VSFYRENCSSSGKDVQLFILSILIYAAIARKKKSIYGSVLFLNPEIKRRVCK